jgi:hypothetical protein
MSNDPLTSFAVIMSAVFLAYITLMIAFRLFPFGDYEP